MRDVKQEKYYLFYFTQNKGRCEKITFSEPANGEEAFFSPSFKAMDECEGQPKEVVKSLAQGPVLLIAPCLLVPAHVPLAKRCR